MITDLVISQLPYVDGLPTDESQKKIAWIKNGDPLLGASTFNGKDGQLNAAGVCISKNVQVQEVNLMLSKNKINELVSNVNNINSILEVSGNDNPISIQVATNTSDISSLKTSVNTNILDISSVTNDVKLLTGKVGEKPSTDTGTRDILDDLFWIKSEIGQYADKDINGNNASGNQATGLKYRVITNTAATAANNAKLAEIEALMEESDVEGTKNDVKALRTEIGLSSSATSSTVYERLTRAESLLSTADSDIDKIKTAIDLSNTKTIDSRVTTNTESISVINKSLNDTATGLSPRVVSLETQVAGTELGTLNYRVTTNTTKVDSLTKVVGSSDSEGLRKEVKWIESQIGSTPGSVETPPTGSILGRLNILTSDTNQISSAIQDIQTDIGNNNEGIKGRVNSLSTKMDGTGASQTTIEGLGVFAYSKNLGTTKIDEAPNDGKSYARKSKTWVPLASSVASLALANKTITLTKTDAQIATSEFTASSVNTDVTVAAGLTVSSSGTYRVKFDSDVASGNVQFTVKKGSADVAVLNKFVKDASNTFVFGSVEEIVKVTSGDIFTVYVKALDDASAVSTQLNNIKLTLIPVF